ncbi:GxxExxY protein [soil metagenome]
MGGDDRLYYEEAYEIVNCAYAVFNALGFGLPERVYENALCVEFRHRGHEYVQQERHAVMYRDEMVGEYFTDLIWRKIILVENKSRECIVDAHINQTLNYLRITKLRLGLVINFGPKGVEFRRVVL